MQAFSFSPSPKTVDLSCPKAFKNFAFLSQIPRGQNHFNRERVEVHKVGDLVLDLWGNLVQGDGRRTIATISPNRVNRAHWPTKGNRQNFNIFFDFSGPRKKWPGMAPNGAGSCFFLLIQTLPTFWATRIFILRILLFGIFVDPKFLRFPNSWAGPHPFCCNISSATGKCKVGQ